VANAIEILVYVTDDQKRVQECAEALLKHTPKNVSILFLGSQLSSATSRCILQYCKRSRRGSSPIGLFGTQVPCSQSVLLNRGLSHAKAQHVVILNENVIVTAGWLEALKECLLSESSIGISCPLVLGGFRQSLFKRSPDRHTIDDIAKFVRRFSQRKYPRITSAEACLFVKKEVIEQLGSFDPESSFPEVEYSHQARKRGFSVAVADQAFVHYRVKEQDRCAPIEDDQDMLVDLRQKFKLLIDSPIDLDTPEEKDSPVEDFSTAVLTSQNEKAKRSTTLSPCGLDYIIPICNTGGGDYEDRLAALNYLIEHFLARQTDVDLHLILVEQVVDSILSTYISGVVFPPGLDHTTVTVEHPIFVKPWLYNIGIANTKYDDFILAESEVYSDQDFLRNVLDFANAKSLKWCFCWDQIYYLSQKCRDILVKTDRLKIELPPKPMGYYDAMACGWCHRKTPSRSGAEGGMVYFQKSFWEDQLHGANELLRELGGNDNDLAYRAYRLSGTYATYSLPIYHLWHAISHIKKGTYKNINMRLCSWLESDDNYRIVGSVLSGCKLGNLCSPLLVTGDMIQRMPVLARWRTQ
jgi:hypothetical protein